VGTAQHRTAKKKNLQSRRAKVDNCYQTRTADDCSKCSLVKSGQFCYPGNYTIEFKTEGQCDNVTFGECNIPKEEFLGFDDTMKDGNGMETGTWKCNKYCEATNRCKYYRYNRQTHNCTLYGSRYRAQYCNIRAAPMEKMVDECVFEDNEKPCDSIVEEDCEYNGKLLRRFEQGDISSSDVCYEMCKLRAPDCKYWIFKQLEKECILKRSGNKTCSVSSGEKMTVNEYENCLSSFHMEK